ncbi:hypothetical protein ES708_10550 [subsurface metagenome]
MDDLLKLLRALPRILWQFGAIALLLGGGAFCLAKFADAEFAIWLLGGVFGAALILVGSWNGERKASKEQ